MSVSPATYNISVQRNATYTMELVFKDSNGDAIDLDEYVVASQVWNRVKSDGAAATAFDIDYTDRDNGKVTLTLTSTKTASLDKEEYYYDVMVKNKAGVKSYYIEGKVVVSEGYTTIDD